MNPKNLPHAEVPKLFSTIAAILLGAIAVALAARAYYGLELIVDTYHVPLLTSWIGAGVLAIVAIFAFREA
jgi:hypothetical protein